MNRHEMAEFQHWPSNRLNDRLVIFITDA